MKYKDLTRKLQTDEAFREEFVKIAFGFLKQIGVEDITEERIREELNNKESWSLVPNDSLIEDVEIEKHFLTMLYESAGSVNY